jgi:hypothetical protein
MLQKFLEKPINLLACFSIRENITAAEKVMIEKQFDKCGTNLYEIFMNNEISSIAYRNLKEYLPPNEQEKWAENYKSVQSRIEFMFDELALLGQKFHTKSLRVVALKNGGLAQVKGADLAEHPMGDIDLFVKKEEFHEAHKAIVAQGFIFEFRSEFEEEDFTKAFSDGSTEYYKILADGNKMWLELSWRSVSGRWINRKKEPNTDDLIRDSIPWNISGIYVLSPEDNLLQVSIHTAKHSYFRAPGFRLHLDVKRVTSYFDIDWDVFIEKVKCANTKTAVYFSLLFSKEMLGADVPSHVLDALKPNLFKIWLINFSLRKVSLQERFYFNRIEFIVFQLCLYDSYKDVIQVAIPPSNVVKIKYGSKFLITGYLLHLLDLVGIRKKYKK